MLAASGTKSMRAAESEDHMFFVLVKQLDLEKVLERAKVELSLMTDFNLIDAFRMFDPDGTGAASHSAIRQVLNELNCRHKEEELLLFMERFDRDKDGAVRYSEFCDAFLPIDSFHASLLAKKAPLSSAQNRPRS
jgi:Ca2+-binding EF-hand superfamily protein